MPRLINNIEATLINDITGDVKLIYSVIGEFQQEDYINLSGFIAYLQNLNKTPKTKKLVKPLLFGLKNKYNLPINNINIDY